MCRDLAAREGIEVTRVYVDDGLSGLGHLNRPGWNDLLADVSAGKFHVLLAQAEDRFTRSPGEKENLMLLCAAGEVTGSRAPMALGARHYVGLQPIHAASHFAPAGRLHPAAPAGEGRAGAGAAATVALRSIDEGLRMATHPGVVFRTG